MSEAMSSVEIEDVLSSIRRLVSEDLRPAPKAPVVARADEKLLLTPAFRVVAATPTVQHSPRAQAEVPVRPTPLPRLHLGVAAPPTDEVVATLQRAVEAQDIEWESEVGDPLPMVARMEWTEDGWAATGEAEGTDVTVETAAHVLPWDQTGPDHDAADLAFFAVQPQPTKPAPNQSEPNQSQPTQSEPTQSEPAQPGPVCVEPSDDWADLAEAEAVAQLQDDQGQPRHQSRAESRPAAEYSFDEQVLRDLVRDLVREELQGDLGERITRNVRKLVRAEISRMIASQDLD